MNHYEYYRTNIGPFMMKARADVAEHGFDALLMKDGHRNGKFDLRLAGARQHALMERYLPEGGAKMEQYFANPDATKLYFFISRVLSKADANAMFMEYWQIKNYERWSRKTFEVSPGLAEQLKFTEFRGVTVDEIRLPYPCVYIEAPFNADLHFRPLAMGQLEERAVRVLGMYVSEGNAETGYDLSPNVKEAFAPGEATVEKIAATRVWRILVIGGGSADPSDMSTFSFDMVLPPGHTPDQCIAIKERVTKQLPEELQNIFNEDADGIAPTWKNLFRWMFNVVAYATMPGAEIDEVWNNKDARQLRDRIAKLPKGGKRNDLAARLKTLDPERRLVLGRSLHKLDVNEKLAGQSTTEGRKLIWRMLVTGHWKMQAFGLRLSERKRIWIKPYWKGPTDGPEVNPKRVVEAPAPE